MSPNPPVKNGHKAEDLKRESGDPTLSGGAAAQNHPENQKEAARATWDNDLTTGHSAPDDGDADNAKR